ncbi:MAG: UDP-galactopyranose mutase [Terracidiphilus sp.]|jgi:UDP-galactopyranose mutase
MRVDVLVVGAGFAGSVVAQRLADAGRQVLVIDKREHIAGSAYDEFDAHGVLVHRYGPHIFHTNSERVWNYLSQFTQWTPYEHRVLAKVGDQLVPFPINQTTINRLYGLDLDEEGVRRFLEQVREPRTELRTSEDVVLNAVGADLCRKLFRNYTRKQWGLDLHQLSSSVLQRIPTRTNRDDRYFTDTFQAMPNDGYTALFSQMLDHPRIRVELGVDFEKVRDSISAVTIVYTGKIDTYFRNCYGALPYRALTFEHQHIKDCAQFQPVAVVNYPNDHAYTRITEFKHMTGQLHPATSIVREYPGDEGEPCYPIPCPDNAQRFQRYRDLAEGTKGVFFVGRLARYQYFNMDQIVASSLKLADSLASQYALTA